MSFILVTNDDGVDALSLPSLARCLERRGTVHVAAPAVERSWIGKAISRFDEVPVKEIERDGVPMMSVAGYPADSVQLGMYNLFDDTVEIVVSGVNIGANFGSAYYSGSGTVGAALEAGIAQVPAFAFSVVNVGHFRDWAKFMATPESIPDWERYAEVSAAIVDEVMEAGYPSGVNILTVNMPAEVTVDTRRHVTHIADTTYGQLFKEQTPSVYRHDWISDMEVTAGMWGSDIQVVANGEIAVTPIRIASAGVESPELRDLWD